MRSSNRQKLSPALPLPMKIPDFHHRGRKEASHFLQNVNPELVNAIEKKFPGMVKHVEIPIHKVQEKDWIGPPQNITDLDVLLKNGVVIQVKTGKGKGLVQQLQDSSDITRMPAIGFDANKFANSGKPDISWNLKGNVQKAGFQFTNDVDELLDMISKYRE
ncbi:hypothetical protein HCH_03255 [Hahella chejuensis KCTC 2396]|uniref:Uncharacterized protein n=2 Tax=Hahella chejuensis TaxID=158327 RepID=Q2SH60_HAHCH|nr:hypothetical protein HCH_03255 [Hahella chejuensis KCTC 2396]